MHIRLVLAAKAAAGVGQEPDRRVEITPETLFPLVDLMVYKYVAFLLTLAHSVRAGTHSNTAFGLIFPLEYDAESKLQNIIH